MKNQNDSVVVPVEVMEAKQGRVIEFRPCSPEFKVFLDAETNEIAVLLNQIRQTAPPDVVIKAVALVRGIQIGAAYAKKYAPHLGFEVEEHLTQLLTEVCGKYLTP